ncbi:NUDIX hydrolase [uncultured Shimia sp.]|uniref:NUDIX hydrolase n=1 Tax=uncultured Shimia sp. TaxID=573152 RepID=UPI0026229DD8|nr:NUDIX hydrolase [uncultured Shimia sp.]
MTDTLINALQSVVTPLLRRPKRLQVAALCHRTEAGTKKVLLVTSRDTGRWVIPKGWPIDGKNAAESALQEAWEEAGVKKAEVLDEALGTYDYDKELKSGLPVRVETVVFSVKVDRLSDKYPEANERTRKWVTPQIAANMVDEPQLQELLRSL